MEQALWAAHACALMNQVLAAAGLNSKLCSLEEVVLAASGTSVLIAAVESIFGRPIPGANRRPATAKDRAVNLCLMVDAVSARLQSDMSHVSGQRIAQGSLLDIVYLLEVLAALAAPALRDVAAAAAGGSSPGLAAPTTSIPPVFDNTDRADVSEQASYDAEEQELMEEQILQAQQQCLWEAQCAQQQVQRVQQQAKRAQQQAQHHHQPDHAGSHLKGPPPYVHTYSLPHPHGPPPYDVQSNRVPYPHFQLPVPMRPMQPVPPRQYWAMPQAAGFWPGMPFIPVAMPMPLGMVSSSTQQWQQPQGYQGPAPPVDQQVAWGHKILSAEDDICPMPPAPRPSPKRRAPQGTGSPNRGSLNRGPASLNRDSPVRGTGSPDSSMGGHDRVSRGSYSEEGQGYGRVPQVQGVFGAHLTAEAATGPSPQQHSAHVMAQHARHSGRNVGAAAQRTQHMSHSAEGAAQCTQHTSHRVTATSVISRGRRSTATFESTGRGRKTGPSGLSNERQGRAQPRSGCSTAERAAAVATAMGLFEAEIPQSSSQEERSSWPGPEGPAPEAGQAHNRPAGTPGYLETLLQRVTQPRGGGADKDYDRLILLARTIALAADQQPRREGDAGPHGLWEASGSEGNKEPEGGGPGEGSEGGRARQHTRRRRDLDGGRRAQRKGRPVAGEAARVYAAGLAGLRPMVDRLALFHPEESDAPRLGQLRRRRVRVPAANRSSGARSWLLPPHLQERGYTGKSWRPAAQRLPQAVSLLSPWEVVAEARGNLAPHAAPLPQHALNSTVVTKLAYVFGLANDDSRLAHVQANNAAAAQMAQQRRGRSLAELMVRHGQARARRDAARRLTSQHMELRTMAHSERVEALRLARVQAVAAATAQSRVMRSVAHQELALRHAFLEALEAEKLRLLAVRQEGRGMPAMQFKSWLARLKVAEGQYRGMLDMMEGVAAEERRMRFRAEGDARDARVSEALTVAAAKRQRIADVLARLEGAEQMAADRETLGRPAHIDRLVRVLRRIVHAPR